MASAGGSRMQSLSPNYIRRGFYPPLPATLPASPIVWPPWGSGCTSQVWYHQQVRKEGNLIQVAPTPAPCLPPLRDVGMWTEGLLCWRWKGAGTPSGGGAAAGNAAAAVPVFCVWPAWAHLHFLWSSRRLTSWTGVSFSTWDYVGRLFHIWNNFILYYNDASSRWRNRFEATRPAR